MWDPVPNLMESDHVVEPGNLSQLLVVVGLGHLLPIVLVVVDVLPKSPLQVLVEGQLLAN